MVHIVGRWIWIKRALGYWPADANQYPSLRQRGFLHQPYLPDIPRVTPITDIQLTSGDKSRCNELTEQGFTRIERDLNTGGGSTVHLWYKRDPPGAHTRPVIDITLRVGKDKRGNALGPGYKRLDTNLNAGKGFLVSDVFCYVANHED